VEYNYKTKTRREDATPWIKAAFDRVTKATIIITWRKVGVLARTTLDACQKVSGDDDSDNNDDNNNDLSTIGISELSGKEAIAEYYYSDINNNTQEKKKQQQKKKNMLVVELIFIKIVLAIVFLIIFSITFIVVYDYVVVSIIAVFDVDMSSWKKPHDAMPKCLSDNNCLHLFELSYNSNTIQQLLTIFLICSKQANARGTNPTV
jgi:hypothetical protein